MRGLFPFDPSRRSCSSQRPAPSAYKEILPVSSASSVSASELDQLLIARHGASAVQRFKSASVGLAGAGGLGSVIAAALARLGIGTLIVADFDRVEAVNLGRQQYFIDQIGLPKVEALRANLQRIHPGVRIIAQPLRVSAANLLELFGTVDILVEAFDDPIAKAELTATWLAACPQRPLVGASGMAGCGPANQIVTRRPFGHFYLCGDGHSAVETCGSLYASRVGIAAHHQAQAVVRLLLGLDPVEDCSP